MRRCPNRPELGACKNAASARTRCYACGEVCDLSFEAAEARSDDLANGYVGARRFLGARAPPEKVQYVRKREADEVHENLQVLFFRFFAIRRKRRAARSGEQLENSAQSVARGFGPNTFSHRHLSEIQFEKFPRPPLQ